MDNHLRDEAALHLQLIVPKLLETKVEVQEMKQQLREQQETISTQATLIKTMESLIKSLQHQTVFTREREHNLFLQLAEMKKTSKETECWSFKG